MAETNWTPGPWYALDFTEQTMRSLGWAGELIDRIVISSLPPNQIGEGRDCVIARIQRQENPNPLGPVNIADGYMMAAAPEMYEALDALLADYLGWNNATDPLALKASAALSRARGEA